MGLLTNVQWFTVIFLFTAKTVFCQHQQKENEVDFAPTVSARCLRGIMTVEVTTQHGFHGVVHTRDHRREPCLVYGNGAKNVTLQINLLANQDDTAYCGVLTVKDKRTVTIAVRAHRTLELSDDKFYLVSCGNSGYRNARNELSRVSLNFVDKQNKKVTELIYGHQYTLRARVSRPDGQFGIRVRSCFSFAPNTTDVPLLDANGCPLTSFLSDFRFNESESAADANLYSTFRFPNNNKVHIQCEVALCKGACSDTPCSSQQQQELLPRALPRTRNGTEEAQLMASTSVYVVEPGDYILAEASTDCTEWRFPWLIGLCICLAVLLLVMLIVNIFLCSSLTCTCTKTEVVEKEPSEMEDYDPYRVAWAPSSHYGSRTSLHKQGYTSGGSTLNSTTRSMSNGSDHYAIVHSRPNSRYSQHSSKEPLHRGPGSTLSNGHYNSRI